MHDISQLYTEDGAGCGALLRCAKADIIEGLLNSAWETMLYVFQFTSGLAGAFKSGFFSSVCFYTLT